MVGSCQSSPCCPLVLSCLLLVLVSHAVELIIPFKEGGGSDVYGELLKGAMAEYIPEIPFTKTNHPGDGGAAAWTHMTSGMVPDNGSVWWMVNLPHVMTQPVAGGVAYSYEDMQICAIGARTPLVLLRRLSDARTNFTDVVTSCSIKKPCIFGGAGNWTAQHLLTLELQEMGFPFKYRGYHSAADAYDALEQGELDGVVTTVPPAIQLKAVFSPIAFAADTEETFAQHFPGVPLLKDMGIRAVFQGIYRGIGLPKSAQESACEEISDYLEVLLTHEQFEKTLLSEGFEATFYRFGFTLKNFLNLYRTDVMISLDFCAHQGDELYFDRREQTCIPCAEAPEDDYEKQCVSSSSSLYDIPDPDISPATGGSENPGLYVVLLIMVCAGVLVCCGITLVLVVRRRSFCSKDEQLAQLTTNQDGQLQSKLAQLVPALCDAVVLLDQELFISKPCPKLANMLRSSPDSLEGYPFPKLMNENDSARFKFHVGESARGIDRSMAPSLNVSLLTGNGHFLTVQLFISSCLEKGAADQSHVVGICELVEQVAEPSVVGQGFQKEANDAFGKALALDEDTTSVVTDKSNLFDALGSVEVVFDAMDEDFTISRCSLAFSAICNELATGTALLDWVAERHQFRGWVQQHVNDFLGGLEPHAPKSCRLILRSPKESESKRCLSFVCQLDFSQCDDDELSREDQASWTSQGVLVRAVLYRPKWECRGHLKVVDSGSNKSTEEPRSSEGGSSSIASQNDHNDMMKSSSSKVSL